MYAQKTLISVLCLACYLAMSNAKIVNRYAATKKRVDTPLQPVVVGEESGKVAPGGPGTATGGEEQVDSSGPHRKHGHHGDGTNHHGRVFGREGHHHAQHNQLREIQNRPRLVAGSPVHTKTPSEPTAAPGSCAALKCKKRHVCVVNEGGVAECVHRKKQNRRKQMKGADVSPTAKNAMKRERNRKRLHLRKMAKQAKQEKKAHKMVKKIKNKADHFKDRYDEKKHHRLHHLRQLASSDPEIHVEFVTGSPGLGHSAYSKQNMTLSVLQDCSPKELAAMGRRFLETFKANQDKNPNHHDHIIQKRNSMKKELHEKDECICQAPVRYEFLTLDGNEDDVLSVRELGHLRSPGHEHCVQPFIETCDHDLDGRLSSKEWCCCFADVLPPCLADMAKVPAAMSIGGPAVMPGAMVPQCDSDGFYKPLQCHGSTGYCWCVDHSGRRVEGTTTRGTPECDHLVEKSSQEKEEISQDLEAQ